MQSFRPANSWSSMLRRLRYAIRVTRARPSPKRSLGPSSAAGRDDKRTRCGQGRRTLGKVQAPHAVQRLKLQRHLRDNPGLKPFVPDLLAEAYDTAQIDIAGRLSTREESQLPAACPWSLTGPGRNLRARRVAILAQTLTSSTIAARKIRRCE